MGKQDEITWQRVLWGNVVKLRVHEFCIRQSEIPKLLFRRLKDAVRGPHDESRTTDAARLGLVEMPKRTLADVTNPSHDKLPCGADQPNSCLDGA